MPSADVFFPAPSLSISTQAKVVDSIPDSAEAVGFLVSPSGEVPEPIGLDRETLRAYGFEGEVGEAFVVPMKEAAA